MQKRELLSLAMLVFKEMGLEPLLPTVDFVGPKPDMVIVHKDKKKYYVAEILGVDCISEPYPRMAIGDDIRQMCSKLYPDKRQASIAVAAYCDLGSGIDLFRYNNLKGYDFTKLQRYAAMIYPIEIANDIIEMLNKLKLQHKSLSVFDKFNITIFTRADTNKLAEARKFMLFMLANS